MEELDFLKHSRRRQLSKAVGEARSHGDISENAEYDAAKEAQALNEKKIAELQEKLSGARIIEHEDIPADEVFIGARVKLKDLDSGEELEYTLVSAMEADFSAGRISVTSPVGQGLLRHKVNDEVQIKIPAGVLRYRIVGIARGEK